MNRGIYVLLAVAVALGLCTAAMAGPRLTVRDDTGKHKYQPVTLRYESRIPTREFKITKLHRWIGWSAKYGRETKAQGVDHYTDCDPRCHRVRQPVTVFLSQRRRCDGHRHRVFRSIYVQPRGSRFGPART